MLRDSDGDVPMSSPDATDDEGRRKLLDDFVARLQHLPSQQAVQEKLGDVVASQYLQSCQSIENADHWHAKVDFDMSRRATADDCRVAVQLLDIAVQNIDSPEGIADDYLAFKRRRNDARRQRKEELQLANLDFIERARHLGIWFPVKSEQAQWLQWSVHGEDFLNLAEHTKCVMKERDRGLLQHIRLRKFGIPSIRDVHANIAAMRAYLIGHLYDDDASPVNTSSSSSFG